MQKVFNLCNKITLHTLNTYMRYTSFLALIVLLACNQPAQSQEEVWDSAQIFHVPTIIQVTNPNDTSVYRLVQDDQMFIQRWDTLAQTKFWRTIIKLPPDSAVFNVAETRQILEFVSVKQWDSLTDTKKESYRDSLKKWHNLPDDTRIFMTTGKSHFYLFEEAIPNIGRAIDIFVKQQVNPWYAQAILLIESPGRNGRSSVGAQGPFQLMKYVATSQGLTVNKYTDERNDFAKAAKASATFIKSVCLPYARSILTDNGLTYNENDLWFRLVVMHVYHAGAGNVRAAINKIAPKEGNLELITTLWQTTAASFGNASQNYSQIALATLLELDAIVYNNCSGVCKE